MSKRCRHNKNFTISEQVLAATVFTCTDGVYDEGGIGYHFDHYPTGMSQFCCFDCGLNKWYDRFAKSTPRFVKDAWERLMEVQRGGSL